MTLVTPTEHAIDCVGLRCPAPILRITKQARALHAEHAVITVTSDDDEFPPDLKAWCRSLGAELLSLEHSDGVHRARVELNRPDGAVSPLPAPSPAQGPQLEQRASAPPPDVSPAPVPEDPPSVPRTNQMTLLVVRNDFESLMSAFMCANASRAQGMDVVMYFAFWGVNVLRAETPRPGPDGVVVRSSFLQSVMKRMMPAGPRRQRMSKMHMGGLGLSMMRYFMKKHQVMPMAELLQTAVEQGVVFKVCTMSMGLMGIAKSDLMELPNLQYGGVTSFSAEARTSAASLVF